MALILALRETTGGTLVYPYHDWMDPVLGRRSMQLMAEQVMPRVNAALNSLKRSKPDGTHSQRAVVSRVASPRPV